MLRRRLPIVIGTQQTSTASPEAWRAYFVYSPTGSFVARADRNPELDEDALVFRAIAGCRVVVESESGPNHE